MGCKAYSHKSDGKLEPKSNKFVFLGYQKGTKGYKLWDRDSSGVRIIISRDVVFNEFVFPCKDTNNDASISGAILEDFNLTGGAQFKVELNVGPLNLHPSVQNTKP